MKLVVTIADRSYILEGGNFTKKIFSDVEEVLTHPTTIHFINPNNKTSTFLAHISETGHLVKKATVFGIVPNI